jgi:mannose-6-phosphate isomerase
MRGITPRSWGFYYVLQEYRGCKIKELVVNAGSQLSYQRHFKRAEVWFVREGKGFVKIDGVIHSLSVGDMFVIPIGAWHQLINDDKDPLCIIEIQHGASCDEADIERL